MRIYPWTGRVVQIVSSLVAALAVSATAASGALSVADPAPAQTVEGSIVAPLRFAQDVTYSSWPGGQRQIWAAAGSNGHVGYTFELRCDDGGVCVEGGRFDLDVLSGATGLEDIDVTFYSSFNPVVSTGGFNTRALGGEEYTIPDGSRFAIVTMFNGLNATFRFRAWTSAAAVARIRGLQPALLPATPGIYPSFGIEGDRVAAWKKRLQSKSHVVIGIIDTGINPYHVAYRRPEYTIHPSLYIEGFPADTPALGLNFGGSDYVSARTGDDGPVWSQVAGRKLYWIPGTNIIGAVSMHDEVGTPPAGVVPRPIIDDDGHGTGTTSVAAGAGFSVMTKAPFGANPEALIVIIEGLGHDAMEWALAQPWIDFVSGSYGNSLAIPYNDLVDGFAQAEPIVQDELGQYEYRYTAPFVLRDGRTALFSAGNGISRTGIAYDRWSSIRPTSGPSWVVTVGAISPRNEQDYGWHSVPADISSYGNHWPSAVPFALDGEQEFGGTSNATPVTAGVFSKALLAVRDALGDAVEGIHVNETPTGTQSVPALGPANIAGGAAGDGVLARVELQDAVYRTARPGKVDPENYLFDPLVVPDTPLYYTMQGYGVANVASAGRAIDVLLGRTPMPARPDVDAWIAGIDLIRDTVWPPPTYGSAASSSTFQPSMDDGAAPEVQRPTAEFRLDPITPNPVAASATFHFRLPSASAVRLEVFDLSGRRVALAAEGGYPAGENSVRWDRRDAVGAKVQPGLYLYRLTAGSFRAEGKLVIAP